MNVVWTLHGSAQLGTDQNSRFGQSIALSSNGMVLAVGSPLESRNANTDGVIYIYQHNGVDWVSFGTIIGQASGDKLGYAIALSNDGMRLALGSPDKQLVRVYDRINSSWVQVGGDLTGPLQLIPSGFGTSVSLSGDGNILVVGAPTEVQGQNLQTPAGAIRIFEYDSNGNDWLEPDVVAGPYDDARYGTTVAISGNGTVIAVGSPKANAAGTERGIVHILLSSNGLPPWSPYISIEGENNFDNFGTAISISDNGSRIVVGSTLHNGGAGLDTGYIRIIELDLNQESYSVMSGGQIEGNYSEELFGAAVAMSGDGNTVVASSSSSGAGFARTFEWDNGEWVELGDPLVGTTPTSKFGTSLALSTDGTRLGVGIPLGGDLLGSPDLGEARVYARPGPVPPTTIPQGNGPAPETTDMPTETTAPPTAPSETTIRQGLTNEEILAIINYWFLILNRT